MYGKQYIVINCLYNEACTSHVIFAHAQKMPRFNTYFSWELLNAHKLPILLKIMLAEFIQP